MYVIIGSRPDAHTIPAYTSLYKLHLELTGEGEAHVCESQRDSVGRR